MSGVFYSLVALAAFVGAAYATPGWMLLLIIVGFIASFVAVFAFAGARIAASSQEQVYVPSKEEMDAVKRKQQAAQPRPTPARPTTTHDGTMAISAADLAKQRKPPGA